MNDASRFFFLLLLCYPVFVFAQPPASSKDSVGYVHVEKKPDPSEESLPAGTRQSDFYRNLLLFRLNLNHPANQPLTQASIPVQPGLMQAGWLPDQKGMVMALLEGLRTGQVMAGHPTNPRRRYDYFDLTYDLLALNGYRPEEISGDIYLEDLGWEWLNQSIDIVVEEGFSSRDSRDFLRIKFIRLIWNDPNSARGEHVLAIFPYGQVRELLQDLRCQANLKTEKKVSVDRFLHFRMFEGYRMSPEKDPSLLLPPLKRSPEWIRKRWPALWEK